MNKEGFNPQEEAFFKKGEEISAENEARAKGETTIGAKKAEGEVNEEDWFNKGNPEEKTF